MTIDNKVDESLRQLMRVNESPRELAVKQEQMLQLSLGF